MTPAMHVTFLGTGTSIGIPAVGCDCATCTSDDPRDQRLRCSIWVQTPECSWLVDSGPDLRQQCLRYGIRELDAVLYTHAHMDHILGFDELRRFTISEEEQLPIYATKETLKDLERMFSYAFDGKNAYLGYIKPVKNIIEGPFMLGSTRIVPLDVVHGKVRTIGFLFELSSGERIAYMSDVKTISPKALEMLHDLDVLVIDALRHTDHPTHMTLPEALETIEHLAPCQSWLTHFQCQIKHSVEEQKLPSGVSLAYDGLEITFP